MKITKNMVAAVSYELEVEGNIADKSQPGAPLEYIQGFGMLLPKFEEYLEGKEPGDEVKFTLSAGEGYGEYDPSYKIDIPKTAFSVGGEIREDLLVVGNIIPMLNSQGQVVQGTVAEVGENSVAMDFNHPMAGKTLNFSVKVESVRAATEKELTEGLHGEFLPKEGGCHCNGGCKDGNCGGDCGCDGEGEGHHCHGEGEGHCHGEGEGHCHGEGEGHRHGEGKGGCCCS